MSLQLRIFEALRYREYRLIWYGQVFVSMGTWMDEVSRGWITYELTNSAVHLGMVRGIQTIPFLFLLPLAGTAADRYSRKHQVLAAQVLCGLVHAATAFLILTGQIRTWHLYVTAFLMAVAQVFLQPARSAMISDSVPPGSLSNAIGLNSIVFNVARSTGPALAGILIAALGTGAAYAIQAALFLSATLSTVQLRLGRSLPRDGVGRPLERPSFYQSIVEGWVFSWKNEAVRTGLLAVMTASLFIVPFTTLLPVFARDLLKVGATGQGLLFTAMGVGATCSALWIASSGDRLPRGLLMLGSVAFYGFAVASLAASPWFRLSVVLMGIAGLSHVHSHALVQIVIQTYSPPELRGRTMAMFQANRALETAGGVLIGLVSAAIGVRFAMGTLGTIGALGMIAIFLALPRARQIR